MNAKELHALAPLGALVKFSDGTSRPPDRFNKKLRAWQHHNGQGYFIKADPGDPTKSYARPYFTLQTENGSVLVVNQVFELDSNKTFEVTPPTPGTIIAGHTYRDVFEVRHVWPGGLREAQDWARAERYVLGKCGQEYLVVHSDGSLAKWTAPEVATA